MATVYDTLTKKIDERIGFVTAAMAHGDAKDYADYQNKCGVIQGLALARREIEDLANAQQEQDDAD